MTVKKICKAKIKDYTYELVFFEEDQQYAIYRNNSNSTNAIQEKSLVGVFDNEEKARDYLKSLEGN